MALRIQNREGESPMSLLYRFTKKVQHSGVLKEARNRRTRKRVMNKNKRRLSALHREQKSAKVEHQKKMGTFNDTRKTTRRF